MINSNFNIGFKLKLYNLYELIKMKIENDKNLNVSSDNLKDHLKYDPDIHAAVIYKLYVRDDENDKINSTKFLKYYFGRNEQKAGIKISTLSNLS